MKSSKMKKNNKNRRSTQPKSVSIVSRGTQVRSADGMNVQPNAMLTIPKSVGLIIPDRLYTGLRFGGTGTNTIPAGAGTFITRRFRPSAAFDIDPLLGSTATPGFAELAALYQYYRVTCSRIFLRSANPSTSTGVEVLLLPLNVDPGATPSLATIQGWEGTPYCKRGFIGMLGSPPAVLSNEISTEKIFGSKMVSFDDAFASAVTTVPTNNWYWAFAYTVPFTLASPIALSYQIDIELGIEFFSRLQLNN